MPYKEKICGVYTITTPNGSVYVGSSHNIKLRWSEHRSRLRHKKHHSSRLQAAWDKHGSNLLFEIVATCESSDLEKTEQVFIDKLNAKLNTTPYVGNVWCNEETRKKLSAVHSSPQWKAARSEIAKRVAAKRGIKVDCSDGRSFDNLHRAAEAFGVSPAGIRHLIATQRVGRLGVRFKKSSDEWMEVLTAAEQRMQTMKKNGTLVRAKKNRRCDIDGCVNKHKGHGLCEKHLRNSRAIAYAKSKGR